MNTALSAVQTIQTILGFTGSDVDGAPGPVTCARWDQLKVAVGNDPATPWPPTIPLASGILPVPASPWLAGIDFSKCHPIAADLVQDIANADASKYVGDPSRCAQILQFPNKTVFWSSKLAVDADGINGTTLDPDDGQNDTSYHIHGSALNAAIHPFAVLPLGAFGTETGLSLGDVAVVVYKDYMTGCIFGDLGPSYRLGEGSIRLHELLMPAAPDCCHRNADGTCARIIDVSIGSDVMFFGFPGSAFGAGELSSDTLEATVTARAAQLFAALHQS
jgi:hypothetical protein